MGWSFGHSRRADLIRDLTRTEVGEKATRTCVAHCYRGSAHRGVLWSVWSVQDKTTGAETRYIGCDILEYLRGNGSGNEWGYKDLCESSGPYYYSCPLAYLEMVPVPDSPYAAGWRANVRAWHAEHGRKLVKGRAYHAKPGVRIDGHQLDIILVTSLKPLRGTASTNEGLHWSNVKFKRTHLAEEVAPAPADR